MLCRVGKGTHIENVRSPRQPPPTDFLYRTRVRKLSSLSLTLLSLLAFDLRWLDEPLPPCSGPSSPAVPPPVHGTEGVGVVRTGDGQAVVALVPSSPANGSVGSFLLLQPLVDLRVRPGSGSTSSVVPSAAAAPHALVMVLLREAVRVYPRRRHRLLPGLLLSGGGRRGGPARRRPLQGSLPGVVEAAAVQTEAGVVHGEGVLDLRLLLQDLFEEGSVERRCKKKKFREVLKASTELPFLTFLLDC